MRITAVELHRFEYELDDVSVEHGHLVYRPGSTHEPPGFVVTIRTDTGLEGHCIAFWNADPMLAQVESIAESVLLGRDPLEREGIWQEMWGRSALSDRTGMGPVDIALWDLAGKHHDASIATLLGGYRERIPTYGCAFFMDDAPDGLNSPEAYGSFAAECQAAGYPGFKIHGHPAGDSAVDIEICRAVRDAVGDGMDLMIDPAGTYTTYAETLKVGRALDELDFLWYEDPMMDNSQSIHASRRLAEELDTLILGNERVRSGPYGRVNFLANDAVDMTRADLHLDGGITGAMKMAAIAEGFGVDIELHSSGPSTLHCLAAIRNTNYFEDALLHPAGVDFFEDQGYESSFKEFGDDGTTRVPDGPGLGVDVDWEFIERRLTDHRVID